MRLIIPDNIKMLADKIAHYMVFDVERKGFYLQKDAPQDVIEAQIQFHNWMTANKLNDLKKKEDI